MIKIFKNHLFLYFCATVILPFLQIVDINANRAFVGMCDSEAQFYECSDGQKHTIKDKIYNLILPEVVSPSLTPPLPIAIQVRGQDTVVEATRIIFSNSEKYGFGYCVDVKGGAKAVLTSSHFEDILVALRVDDAVIKMTYAVIDGRGMAVIASGEKITCCFSFCIC